MKISKFDLLKNYEKKWIAIDKNYTKVLTNGNTIKEVENKLKRKKTKAFAISYVAPFDSHLSPYVKNSEVPLS